MTKPKQEMPPENGGVFVEGATETITVERLKEAQKQMGALVRLHRAGVTEIPADVLADIERFAAVPVPSAPALAKAAMLGYVDGDGAMVAWHRARRGLYALAPRLVEIAANKIESRRAPGDSRIIIKMLEGLGLLNPAEPLTTEQRGAEMTKERVRGMSDAELAARLEDLTRENDA